MNFNFNLDKNNRLLTLTVSVEFKKTAGHPRIKLGWPTIKSLVDDYVDQNADYHGLIEGFQLGECKNPVQGLDNAHQDKCSGIWIFELILPNSKQRKVVTSAVDWKAKSKAKPKKTTNARTKKPAKKTKEDE